MREGNRRLKGIYREIFRRGYANTYTTVYTQDVVMGRDVTNEMKEVLKEGGWKGKRVADVGCGTGLFSYAVAGKGAKVLGIDYAPEAIEEARSRYRHKNLEYRVGDAGALRGQFDIIASIGTLEHMDDPLRMLRVFKRHLVPGGKILITSPNWTNPRGYILQTLLQLFDAPITLADLHYLTPLEFHGFATKLGMSLQWRTFDRDWAHGERLISDFRNRLPKVLRQANLPCHQKKIDRFLVWLEQHVLALDHSTQSSGATAIYILQ